MMDEKFITVRSIFKRPDKNSSGAQPEADERDREKECASAIKEKNRRIAVRRTPPRSSTAARPEERQAIRR